MRTPGLAKASLTCLIGLSMSGCGLWNNKDSVPTIASIKKNEVVVNSTKLEKPTQSEITDKYLQLLSMNPVDNVKIEATRRVADIELERDVQEASEDASIRAAIARYEWLLSTYRKQPNRDRVLYQLSRAYDQIGRIEKSSVLLGELARDYPDSQFIDEVHFRLGEYRFVLKDYSGANEFYDYLAVNTKSRYFGRALYKKSWSLIKLNRNSEALDSLFRYLDWKYAAYPDYIEEKAPKDEAELLEDIYRAISLVYAFSGKIPSVDELPGINSRQYAHLVYEKLGNFYREKDRIRDAAETYSRLFKNNPKHGHAPGLLSLAINTYEKNGFIKIANETKSDFVSEYISRIKDKQVDGVVYKSVLSNKIQTYLNDLSRYHHTLAQQTEKSRKTPRNEHFIQAVKWYRVYLDHFMKMEKSPEIHFMLADLLNEYGSFQEASNEYEHIAYQYPSHRKTVDAAYSSITTTISAQRSLKGNQRKIWVDKEISRSLRFIEKFENDKRASKVGFRTAELLYDRKDFSRVVAVSDFVLKRNTADQSSLYTKALNLKADGLYQLGNYEQSESAYKTLLASKFEKDRDRKILIERLAESIYRQGESLKNDPGQAAAHYLRVKQLAPQSKIVPIAQYDAASALIEIKQWKKAESVLKNYIARYPAHKLIADAEKKLISVYLETGKKKKAAHMLEGIARSEKDPQNSRDALAQAIDLYRVTKDSKKEIAALKSFVKRFPSPLDDSMPARERLAELYGAGHQTEKQQWWLKEIIRIERKEQTKPSASVRLIAAKSALKMADYSLDTFKKLKIRQPLKATMRKKQTAMKKVLSDLSVAVEYDMASITTEATYKMASVYQLFSIAMLQSERPKGLNQDELEQYQILLEDKAYPFEEEAIKINVANTERIPLGYYDKWTSQSLADLARLYPARYNKVEEIEDYSDEVR